MFLGAVITGLICSLLFMGLICVFSVLCVGFCFVDWIATLFVVFGFVVFSGLRVLVVTLLLMV